MNKPSPVPGPADAPAMPAAAERRAARGTADATFEVVIVGGGAAGIAVAASLRKRQPRAGIAIVEPADTHHYQAGWSMVGAGIVRPADTARPMGSLIPPGVRWIRAAAAAFLPNDDALVLEGGKIIRYERLVVCPGLELHWDAVEGLRETLGRNGVTSNYRADLASYTWKLVRRLRCGQAIFTQAPSPIKCPGAPQKALYLSADAWRRRGVLGDIAVHFASAEGALFEAKDYVPALLDYVDRYRVQLDLRHRLVSVDGPARLARFAVREPGAEDRIREMPFDMLHVCPPQRAPRCVRHSPLADGAGWVDVDRTTLRHPAFDNVWALGDVINAPVLKSAAAARAQAPVVAANLSADMEGRGPVAQYNGYGACPLTVERGKVVLPEIGYGGTPLPTFPRAVIDGTRPSRAAWLLKERILPSVYWQGMLKGREWLVEPETIDGR